MSRAPRRLAVALAALVLALLAAEGALVLLLDTSIRELVRGRPPLADLDVPPPRGDRERFAAAARTAGPFRVPPDPLVGLTFKVATEVEHDGARLRTDELGLAARAGAPVRADDFHVVLLGADGAGYARELEALVHAAAPDAAFACTSVAVPGWNGRNAVRHLSDHLDRLAPDLVVLVCEPDLVADALAVDEAGRARRAPDPAVPRPLCVVAPEDAELLGQALTAAGEWRVADLAGRVTALARRLERTGARLVVAPLAPSTLARALAARLAEQGIAAPVLPLLARAPAEPAAEEVRAALAAWTAHGLAEASLLPFALAPETLPEPRAPELARADVTSPRDDGGADAPELDARIEPASARGARQVYGGLDAEGRMGIECAFVLPAGRTLALELVALGDSPGLYPHALEVAVDGAVVGAVTLEGAERAARAELALPASDGPLEVRLTASDWTLLPAEPQALGAPVSARILSAETRP